jgi:hypothetical protein
VCDVEQPWLEKSPTILGVCFALLCVAKQPWLEEVTECAYIRGDEEVFQ